MISIVIPGEVPSKKNSRINTRSGRSFPSRAYQRWHDMAMFHAITQAKGKKAPDPCEITVTLIHGDMRRRDCDNGLSSVLDMLVDSGILSDDDWKHVRNLKVLAFHRKGKPECRVEIEEAPAEYFFREE